MKPTYTPADAQLAAVEAAIAARFEPAVVDALLAPVRLALASPAAARDREALAEAFDQIDDVLELCRLAPGGQGA